MRCTCLSYNLPTKTTQRQHLVWLKIPLVALVFFYSAILANPLPAALVTPATHLIQTYLQKHPVLMQQKHRLQEVADQNIQQLGQLSTDQIQELIQINPSLQNIISIYMNQLHQRSLKHPNNYQFNTG
jgi:hypothetical protein